MTSSLPFSDEARRLDALRSYSVLDTQPEQSLDDLTALAAHICETPIALITLVDEQRQWFKSKAGFQATETPRDVSFCAHSLGETDLLIVPDATKDVRFATNPLVTQEPHIRFYAGAPLITPEGFVLGALCVIDHVPRVLAPAQEQALRVLSRQVMTHLELCRQSAERKKSEETLRFSEARFASVFHSNPAAIGINTLTTGRLIDGNDRLCEFFGWNRAEVIGKTIFELGVWEHPSDRRSLVEQVLATGSIRDKAVRLRRRNGEVRDVLLSVERVDMPGETEPVLLVMFIDITEHKLAVTALQERTQQLQLALHVAHMGVWQWHLPTDTMTTIEGAGPISGLSSANYPATGDGFYALVHPQDRAFVRERLRIGLEQQASYQAEFRIVLPDGSVRWVSEQGQCTHDPKGRPLVMFGVDVDITARKLAEQAVAEKGEILQTIFDHIPVMLCFINPAGRIVLANREFERDLGWSLEEIRSHPDIIAELYPDPESRARVLAFIREGTGKFAEFQPRTHTGEVIVASFANVLLADGTSIGIGLDITDQKIADEARRITDARYRTLFEYAPDGILIGDPESRYIDANPSICKMLGHTRDELLGMTPADIVAQAEIEHIKPALTLIHAGVDHNREWQLRRKDGSVFAAEVMATVMPDGNLLGMIRDITERKRTEERFRRLVDSNAQGVMFWNTKGEVSGANDAFLRIIGYSREELEAGRINWIALTPPEYAALDELNLADLASKGTCGPMEKEYIRKDGSRAPILIGAATFADSPEEGVCFVLDLSERKKLEQQFLRAQRMESIGTLAGGIAHDLNNVLGPIILSLDLLNMAFPDPSSQELISIISSSAQRGADMVRQVLSFARGVEGRRMEVQVQHVIREIERIANDTFLKHIHIRTIIPHDLWTVIGDPTQLHQVLLNLCVNARDAMPNGGALTLSAENIRFDSNYAGLNPEAHPGPYVILQIKDTGSGIPPDIIEKIFDPFFTTKDVGKGTGLGLSTTLAIVKSHGGFIRVDSEEGKGTVFKIHLPAETEPSAETTAEIGAEMPRGRGELILVVDDESSVRQIVQQTLEAYGYKVLLAGDGAEATAIYATRGSEIAVVLTDMTMPVMDGPATIKVLRKINPSVRIIGASGLSLNGQLMQSPGLGVKHFLPKPYTAEALLKMLRQILDK